jgi:hypothetical protein
MSTVEINYRSYTVRLGPLSSALYQEASWAGDGYPAWQMFADELEALLGFAKDSRVLEMYRKELRGRANQRDSAIEELRVAKVLSDNGFPVIQWRPIGLAPKEGEFLVRGPDHAEIFVEVKSPGWEGEISEEERRAGRLQQPKYLGTDAFFANSGASVRFAVDKAYAKFDPKRSNLLVVADDLLFPLAYESSFWARDALYWDDGKFNTKAYTNLGGVGFLVKQQQNDRVWAEMRLFLNPHALVPLPDSIVQVFNGCVLT